MAHVFNSTSAASALVPRERAVADNERTAGVEKDGATVTVVGVSAGGVGHAVAIDDIKVDQADVGAGGNFEHPRDAVAADGRGSGGHALDRHVLAHRELTLGQHDRILDG